MRPNAALALFAFVLAASAPAKEKEGGHTGNGGGAVFCGKEAPLVLDYFEIPVPRADVVDVEKLSREELTMLVESRLRAARGDDFWSPSAWLWLQGRVELPDSLLFLAMFRANGPVDSWPTTRPWRVRDEAIENMLPPGCGFRPAAISRGGRPARIPEVSDLLSPGQKRVLELHETLFAFADYYGQFAYNGTSGPVRKLVRALLRKEPTRADLRVALLEFIDPTRTYRWDGRDAVPDPVPAEWDFLTSMTGVYALDLRAVGPDRAAYRACPAWIGLAPSTEQNHYLYAFDERATGDAIQEYFLPRQTIDLPRATFRIENAGNRYVREAIPRGGRSSVLALEFDPNSSDSRAILRRDDGVACPYAAPALQPYRSFPSLLFSSNLNGKRAPIETLKNLIEHYELKRRGIPSPFETDVRRTIQFFQ